MGRPDDTSTGQAAGNPGRRDGPRHRGFACPGSRPARRIMARLDNVVRPRGDRFGPEFHGQRRDEAWRPSGRRVGGCLRSPRGERHSECGNVMGRDADRLGQLARIARVKADGELRTYSARRAQADAMQRQVDAVRDELTQAIASPGSDALEQWRQTTALVGYRSEQLQQAEAALNRIRPGLETARQAAIRAFGRAEALTQLQALTRAQSDLDRQRRGG